MNIKTLLAAVAALACAAAFAAEVSLTDEEKQMCADQGGCVFTSAGFIRARLQAAFEAGIAKGKAECLARNNT